MFHESRSNIFQLLSNNFYSCKITTNAETATAMISLIRTLNKVCIKSSYFKSYLRSNSSMISWAEEILSSQQANCFQYQKKLSEQLNRLKLPCESIIHNIQSSFDRKKGTFSNKTLQNTLHQSWISFTSIIQTYKTSKAFITSL